MTEQNFHAAVLGSPIAHSKSPDMHRAAYQYLDAPIQYDRVDVNQDQADSFMSSLTQRYGPTSLLAGFSVTMPLKAVLVEHMDHVSPRVERLGVLNTIVFDADGIPHGHNTDVEGIYRALRHAGFVAASGGSMGIIGAGGTASAAVGAAAAMGLDEVVLYVRNRERAQDAATVAQRFNLAVQVKHLDEFSAEVQDHRAVVSTLPATAADWLETKLPNRNLPPLLDVIYEPWPTVLAATWQATGAQVASGLDMLLYQGVEQVKLFTAKMVNDHDTIDWDAVTAHMAVALGLQHPS
ncbi:MAG: shikimate dehydrogenase [Micrococcaceae bacterium]|nr:shikimate dehydrogenase [Micrococcaceae bacterium]